MILRSEIWLRPKLGLRS